MIVFGAPRRYVQGPGVMAEAGREIARLGQSTILVIDPAIKASVGATIERGCTEASVELEVLDFGGESSPDEIDRLLGLAASFQVDVVVAAGGGKCIDIGKALAKRLSARVVTVPTIASNDAPTSHIYVLYDSDHRLLRVEELDHNPDLVLVDTEVIARAPADLLRAGIGDALVKKYEVEQCIAVNGRNVFGSKPSIAALAMARGCYDTLRADAVAALAAVSAKKPDAALERIVEACVLLSGLSFENGGLSIAHAMTRGVSAIKAIAGTAHGYQVVYGLTVQLLLEGRDDRFMADYAAFCREVGLPISLAALGLKTPSAEDCNTIAELTLAAPHLKNFTRLVSKEQFLDAMRRAEALDAQRR